MSYNPTQWSAGDTVTSAKLNKIEQGISDNRVLEINAIVNEETREIRLDKTWQEIYNASDSIIIIPYSEEYPTKTKVIGIDFDKGIFTISAFGFGSPPIVFSAATPDDYPITNGIAGGNTQPMA